MVGVLKALDSQTLPTPKQEEWKYTNLVRALSSELLAVRPQAVEERVIHRSRGQNGGQVEDIVWMGAAGAHQQPILRVTVEEGAELTLIERHTGQGAYWKNMVTEISVGKNARFHHIRLQEDSLEAVQTNLVRVTLEIDEFMGDGLLLQKGARLLHRVAVGNAEELHGGESRMRA